MTLPTFAARLGLLLLPVAGAFAQSSTVKPSGPTAQQAAQNQWYLRDWQTDKTPGIGATRAYAELLKGRTPTVVVVAVIDSGIDTAHVDLKPVLWTNRREIPGNGIDDDKNGYVDDVHGWNFLGGADGRNIGPETLEITRLVAAGRPLFKGKTRQQVAPAQREAFDLYQQAETLYGKRLKETQGEAPQLEQMAEMKQQLGLMNAALKQSLGTDRLDTTALRAARPADAQQARMAGALLSILRETGKPDTDALLAELSAGAAQNATALGYQLRLDFDPRADIVKDNPADVAQRGYGNADLHGPDPLHGTHVAGIIAAVRDNRLGVQGIAPAPVEIMTLRAVPDGDERDKDVALAIRYAADNGASVINMSFGKELSAQRPAVEAAFRYAASKNVLLVHAAGNEDDDLALVPHYPAALALDGKPFENLLTVGASGPADDRRLVASFSNYNREQVDVFAPGVDIYSTLPGSTYGNESGTSMAAPVTAGVAATLKSYFPQLTAVQLKDIIRRSATVHHTLVEVPGGRKKVDFATLSATGGVVNLYEAVKLAVGAGLVPARAAERNR